MYVEALYEESSSSERGMKCSHMKKVSYKEITFEEVNWHDSRQLTISLAHFNIQFSYYTMLRWDYGKSAV